MPYQPTHPHPYLETIDVESWRHVFSMIINPKDVITKYNFSIFAIGSPDPLYTTDIVDLDTYLYGTEDGTELPIVISSDVDTKMENGNNYQWQIVLYDNMGKSITSPLYYFSTKKEPKISFSVPTTINTCEHTFQATFEQEQVDYIYYKYSLYRNGVLIDETPEKMDSLLLYKYSGFVSGNEYRINFTLVTPDRNIYTRERTFKVEYTTQSSLLSSEVSQDSSRNCVNIDYSENLFIKGNKTNLENDVVFSTYNDATIASLPKGNSVYYNEINGSKPLSIGEDFTIYYNVHFSDLFIGDIISLTNEVSGDSYIVRYDGKKFYYKIGYGSWIAIDPYIDSNNIHQEASVVHIAGTSDIDMDTLYMLYPNDDIQADSVILYNDITANFWWTFVLLPDKVMVYKGQGYHVDESNESVVSE